MADSSMKKWLQDEAPVHIDENGQVQSAFPFELNGRNCPHCHSGMIQVCGLEQCPACPTINQWIQDSREALTKLRQKRKAADREVEGYQPIEIVLISDKQHLQQ